MSKFCSQCGYKFEKEYKFCPECGTKISGSKNSNVKSSDKTVSVADGEKTLNPKVIYGILVGGIAFVAIILLTSGMFDSAPVTNAPVNQNQQQGNVSSGVNLNNMQMINDLEAKIKTNPKDYKSLLELAHLKNDSGLYEAAIQNYKTYLDKNPKDADARIDMGVCYFNLKDFPTAITEMETALKYEPNHQIALLNLGVVNLSAGNLEKSKEWLKKAVELDPTSEIGKKAEQLLNNH
ncbi:MAG: tetratricopeptide repeat protein [Ignavibacteriaceae bacterium]|nr:tetratricopeptide repeat protein [Ignavibacterium sp.]MCC6255410.1 tetratricopeptide repeat protein [Ignavibacteriaceae bacterium]HMN23821.1 tetratricopeptide repeat protein [Ignavibacteriaceae bacterium]HRN27552.1 tetratricopeptide repeat protein [Ignavibacteriaceae bacterium]HRP92798.1 tetratricopeptide repeat protein [Ignavibacteriaceae bacterium]